MSQPRPDTPLAYPVSDNYTMDARVELTLAGSTIVQQWLDDHRDAAIAFTHELLARYGHPVLGVLWMGWATFADRLKIPVPPVPSGMVAHAYAANFVQMARNTAWWTGAASLDCVEQIAASWELMDEVTAAMLGYFARADRTMVRLLMESVQLTVVKKAPEWRGDFDE